MLTHIWTLVIDQQQIFWFKWKRLWGSLTKHYESLFVDNWPAQRCKCTHRSPFQETVVNFFSQFVFVVFPEIQEGGRDHWSGPIRGAPASFSHLIFTRNKYKKKFQSSFLLPFFFFTKYEALKEKRYSLFFFQDLDSIHLCQFFIHFQWQPSLLQMLAGDTGNIRTEATISSRRMASLKNLLGWLSVKMGTINSLGRTCFRKWSHKSNKLEGDPPVKRRRARKH